MLNNCSECLEGGDCGACVDRHAEVCRDMNELYHKKNADYGGSFAKAFAEYGMLAPIIRMEDKLNRVKQLAKTSAKVYDESMVDTLKDLANYAILTVLELEKR